jgi:predicted flap endonuclease-1-like 5' DNA nuclease
MQNAGKNAELGLGGWALVALAGMVSFYVLRYVLHFMLFPSFAFALAIALIIYLLLTRLAAAISQYDDQGNPEKIRTIVPSSVQPSGAPRVSGIEGKSAASAVAVRGARAAAEASPPQSMVVTPLAAVAPATAAAVVTPRKPVAAPKPPEPVVAPVAAPVAKPMTEPAAEAEPLGMSDLKPAAEPVPHAPLERLELSVFAVPPLMDDVPPVVKVPPKAAETVAVKPKADPAPKPQVKPKADAEVGTAKAGAGKVATATGATGKVATGKVATGKVATGKAGAAKVAAKPAAEKAAVKPKVAKAKPSAKSPAGLERLAAPRGGKADDLKEIEGIGPALEKLANALGFYHFDQIASWTDADVALVDAEMKSFKGRIARDKWVSQARIIVSEGLEAFRIRAKTNDY